MRLINLLRQSADKSNRFIETNFAQRLALTAGSGLISIFDPYRDDLVGAFGELTGQHTLPRIQWLMNQDPEGRLILQQRPVVTSRSVNLAKLAKLPPGTFGYEYVAFLERNGITPDTRKPVRFVQNTELAYVMQRYREIHDFTHCILGMRTNMLGEVTVKVFEAVQLGLPMCWLGGMFGVLRLGPKNSETYLRENLPWVLNAAVDAKPLICVYFEKHFETPIDQLRAELNLRLLDSGDRDQASGQFN
jgi:ubiquinone biosynthesis protein COQ4